MNFDKTTTAETPLIRIVDDEERMRESLAFMLKHEGFECCVYPTAESFLKGDTPSRPGCLLLDVQMDGMTGLELQEEMIRRGITLPIVFLSAHGDLDMAVDAMRRGACAFIQKTADRARLLQAIVDAMAKSRGAVGDSTPGALVAAWNTLTDREKEVAKLVAEGLLNREVGERLGGIAVKTVQVHRSEACSKLGVKGEANTMKSKHDVWAQQSRRRFLADTALGAAGLGLGAAGMESAQAQTKWEKMIKGLQTVTTDVLIVGSGAAGTAAAIEARRSGASVLVIEKMGSLGGSSIISRGALAVPRSPMQRAMGIDDSPEHFADDLMSSAYCGHPGRIECLALEALPTFEWLTNEIGVRWVMDAVGSEIEQSVPRSAIVAGDGAAALMMPLLDRARTLDAEFEVNEKLLHLITRETYDGVAVTGAVVENTRTGLRRCINVRRGVVLAAGGFAADAPFRQRYNQRLSEHVGTATQPGSTSEVLREAARIGAWLVHLQYITCIPDANPVEKGWGTSWQFSRWCAGAQGLWVERQTGRRFVNEMSSTAERTNGVFDVLNADRDVVAIADARAVRHPGSMVFTASDVELLVSRGFVQKYETLALLAQACGIPLSNLKVEVELYNRAITAAREGRTAGSFTDRLGRPIAPEAELMEEGPWYCAPLLAKVLMCSGGLAIDLKSRVLSVVDDRPIPGLFAAGEITGGLNGKGDAGACGLMDAIVFGRIAGREAARIPKDYSDWREMNPLVFHQLIDMERLWTSSAT